MPLSLTLTGAACSDDLGVDGQALTRLADVVPVVVGMRPDADPVGAENLCHQAIFVDDATRAVMPPDLEMIQVGDALSRSTIIRWRWFQIRVRSSSSRRQLPTHRSMTEFIRGA